MRISGSAPLNPGEVIDQRGAGVGPGCLPFGLLLGGGGGGVVVLLLLLLLFGVFGGGGSGSSNPNVAGSSNLSSQCTTGAAAAQNSDCRVVAVVNSIQSYWATGLPQQRGVQYVQAPTVLFSDATSTGCGFAVSQEGPFYCPNDKRVYLDLSFFDDLRSQLGANGGAFAQAYVIAHEYGHHVQDLLGVFNRVGSPTKGATGTSVRLELQADCYAGVWAHHAQDTKIIEDVTSSDINDALNAAASVGDDRIENSQSGTVKPDTFTHGTSDQRDRWFTRGYTNGNMNDCDTFSASSL
jgi:predicted metalloprotease